MKKGLKISLIFTVISILIISFVLALDSVPCAFKGNIIIKNGGNPDGKILTAWVDGVATGSAVISNNKYNIIVADYTYPYNGKVTFKLRDELAKESADFSQFDIIELNLTFDKVPTLPIDCGNGVCDDGECSTCAIDCPIASCLNNSRCDLEIGESCLNAPSDCGSCCGNGVCSNGETCSDCPSDCGSCPSGGSGGGGGGGGSSGGSSSSSGTGTTQQPLSTNSNNTNSNNNENPLSINELNKHEEEKKNSGSSITGAVIGFAKKNLGIALAFITIILILGLIVIYTKYKGKKDGKEKTDNN